MNRCVVEMWYPGKVISVNHYRSRGKNDRDFVKPEARAWMNELGWKVKMEHIEDWELPLHVNCDGVFVNKRSQPDLSNLSKVILDAIEDVTGINDRDMRWHDGNVFYGQDPHLIITISDGTLDKEEV